MEYAMIGHPTVSQSLPDISSDFSTPQELTGLALHATTEKNGVEKGADKSWTACECFQRALTSLSQFPDCDQTPEAYSTGDMLRIAREAVEACRAFSLCSECVQGRYVLLYIAILGQIAVCYKSLVAHRATIETPDVRLQIGAFELQTTMVPEIRQMFICSEVRRAAMAAADLTKNLQKQAQERVTGDLGHQIDLANVVRTDLQALTEPNNTWPQTSDI